MKFNLAFVVAVIGVGMVAADENLKSKLQMALKSMLNENEELQMENRDTKGRCDSATNSCNNHGTCTEDAWGSYYCRCQMPYRVGGKDSSCYLYHYRDVELEMLTRDSLRRCNADTNNCDGFGQCQAKQNRRYAGEYICMCETGYKNNLYGGCSPMTTREIEYLAMLSRDVQMELASKSFSQCNLDTNDCDGYGECVESEDGRYFCQCSEDYENNDYGGCSPIVTPAAEVDDDNLTERKKEIMRQLAEFLKEE